MEEADLQSVAEIAQAAGIDSSSALVDDIYDIAAEYRTDQQSEFRDLARTKHHLELAITNLEGALSAIDAATMETACSSLLRGIYKEAFSSSLLRDIYRQAPVAEEEKHRPGQVRLNRHSSAPMTPEFDIEITKRLATALRLLLSELPASGRPSARVRNTLFLRLANFYEHHTGAQFRAPDKRDKFRGTTFVTSIAKITDPAFSDVDIKAALDFASRKLSNLRKDTGA